MRKFLKNLVVFLFLAVIAGELIVRLTHSVTDLPERKIDEYGIQKYYPNQSGYWKGGDHQWTVNKLGWPGRLPKSYSNLITIIGDSYIENFMNPEECHQSVLLKRSLNIFNFIEAGRSGVSFIESMEISKQFDSLKPVCNLIYVNNNDFYESVSSIRPLKDITQLDIEKNKIIYGKMRSPKVKKILYNWKLLYYLYNRFPLNFSMFKVQSSKKESKELTEMDTIIYEKEVSSLLEYVKNNYEINTKLLVFHPNSEKRIIEICKKNGFNVMVLNSENDKTWSFEHDSHWTCYGHDQVAKQVAKYLNENIIVDSNIP